MLSSIASSSARNSSTVSSWIIRKSLGQKSVMNSISCQYRWKTSLAVASSSFSSSTATAVSTPSQFPLLSQQQQPTLYHHQLQCHRFKHSRGARHASKMGQHLKNLDEMAHEQEREEARERRQKKKDKLAVRKQKGGGGGDEAGHHSDDEDHDDNDEEEDMIVLPDPVETKVRMMKICEQFQTSLRGIRGAEPTPELFDHVVVDAYGEMTPLKAVAQVVIESPTLATATPFDPALSKAIKSAIEVKLELNPDIIEGENTIRIPIPRVSMETRQNTVAQLKKKAEQFRQRVRKIRRSSLDVVKQGVAGKLEGVSKDDAFRVQKEMDHVTETVISKINDLAKEKEDSIMAM